MAELRRLALALGQRLGSYGAAFFGGPSRTLFKHVLISGSVLVITALNLMATEVIGRAEEWIVGLKLAILLVFVGVGVWGIEAQRLAASTWNSPLRLVSDGIIILVAYEGSELIATILKHVRDPARTLSRAFYLSVPFVVVLHIAVSFAGEAVYRRFRKTVPRA